MSIPAESRAEQKERTRHAILEAALDLSEEGGIAAVSLRQVSREVGIVPTAFYRHFADVSDLGLALVEESFAALRDLLRDARDINVPVADSRALFLAIVDTSIDALVSHASSSDQLLRFIARERFAGPPAVRVAVLQQLALVERELATDIARVPGANRWSTEDLQLVANLIVNAMLAHAVSLAEAAGHTDEVARIRATARRQLHMVLIGALQWDSSR